MQNVFLAAMIFYVLFALGLLLYGIAISLRPVPPYDVLAEAERIASARWNAEKVSEE